VGLIQGAIEKAGIPTVSISLLREVTQKVAPPRVLFVDRPLGYPLGTPHMADEQHEIIAAALKVLESTDPLPLFVEFASPAR
jgi:D-proline reductase (dithiol) PrdB